MAVKNWTYRLKCGADLIAEFVSGTADDAIAAPVLVSDVAAAHTIVVAYEEDARANLDAVADDAGWVFVGEAV